MNEPVIVAAPTVNAAPEPAAPTFKSRFVAHVRQVTAIVCWLYLLVKLFVFDIDVYIVQTWLPNYSWLITYKLFIFIGVAGALAIIFKKWQIIKWGLYIAFFPFIFLGWAIPVTLFKTKSWILTFALINGAIYFFSHFKTNLLLLALFLLSALALAIGESRLVLYIACCAMCTFIIWVYIRRIISVFKKDEAFGTYTIVFAFINKHIQANNIIEKSIASVPMKKWTATQLEKRKTNIESAVVANRVCLFVASKLRAYQSSRISILADIFGLLGLFIVVVMGFAFINMGLYKLSQDQFAATAAPSSFIFFYYSFNTFVLSSINELTPVGVVAQSVSMFEKLCFIIMTLIFGSILLSLKPQRQSEELAQAIADIEANGRHIESFLASHYKLTTIEDAIAELERLKGSLLAFILWISNALPPRS